MVRRCSEIILLAVGTCVDFGLIRMLYPDDPSRAERFESYKQC